MPNFNTNIMHESPFFLSEARQHIDIGSTKTLRDWVERGRLRYKDRRSSGKKQRIYLEVIALPGGLATSLAAYERFILELNK